MEWIDTVHHYQIITDGFVFRIQRWNSDAGYWVCWHDGDTYSLAVPPPRSSFETADLAWEYIKKTVSANNANNGRVPGSWWAI